MENIPQNAGDFNAPSENATPAVSPTPNQDLLKVGLFSSVDLMALRSFGDTPMQLATAAQELIAATETKPRNEWGNYGRFDFSSQADSARNAYAAIRICRTALDFLEADLAKSVDFESYNYRQQVLLFTKWSPPKSRVESAEDAYWELMERLNEAGLSYDEFKEIMDEEAGDDGEVEA